MTENTPLRPVHPHPVGALLSDALRSCFPAADGGWHRLEPWRPGVEAVLAFTGHAVLCVGPDVPTQALRGLGIDGFGGAHHPRVLSWLAGVKGWVDTLDVLLVAAGTGAGPGPLVARTHLVDHPRAGHARRLRSDIHVLGAAGGRSVVLLSRGVGRLPEVSIELDPADRGRGQGRALLAAVRGLVPAGEPLVAGVAAGNAMSLRAFLGAGFAPVGSVQLVLPGRD